MGVGTSSYEPIYTPYVPSSSSNPSSTMAGTNVGTNIGANANQPFLIFMEGLNLHDLTKLINDLIFHDTNWPNIQNKNPSDIPMFEGKPREYPSKHIIPFHLWFSSNSITKDSIRLILF
jgi:hypothetical protein